MTRWVKVSCPGTCGELFQGYLGEKEYLVTLPIKRYSQMIISESKVLSLAVGDKAKQAFYLTCQYFGYGPDNYPLVKVTRQSDLSIGKGMASSTADIMSMIYGTAAYLKQNITEAIAMKICCNIEKTDSLIYQKLTVMSPSDGHIYHQSSWMPRYRLIILEGNATIDTEKFHKLRNERLAKSQEIAYRHIFKNYQTAVEKKSETMVAKIATASSQLNQELLTKPLFKQIELLANRYGALGIMVAHSGTVVALIFSLDQVIPTELYAEFKKKEFQCEYSYSYEVETTRGGVTILTNDN